MVWENFPTSLALVHCPTVFHALKVITAITQVCQCRLDHVFVASTVPQDHFLQQQDLALQGHIVLPLPSLAKMAHTLVLDSCLPCPEGSYCIFQNLTEPCPAGFYCPPGTGLDYIPCERGTYGVSVGLGRSDQCFPCDSGMFCGEEGSTEPTGVCAEGYYCVSGVDRPQPVSSLDITFLELNVSLKESYNSQYDLELKGFGGICPIGHYCPSMSAAPIQCFPGSYSPSLGASFCLSCPPGMYCLIGTSDPSLYRCVEGHYCNGGSETSTQNPCPPGTYNDRLGAASVDDCIPCPNGSYCFSAGLSGPTGPCSGGYSCSEGSSSPTPSWFSGHGSWILLC